MRSVNLPGVLFGFIGLYLLSGAGWGQDYPEWGAGYPGWGGGAYPYPYAPSYGYGSTYGPGYPPLQDYQSGQVPGVYYSGDAQPDGGANRRKSPLDPGMPGSSEEAQAAAAVRYAQRRRAMEERRQALQIAIEKRLAETSATQQPSAPTDSAMNYGAAAELQREMQAGPEDAAVRGTVPPGGEHLGPGSGERRRAAGDGPPMRLGMPHRPSYEERRAALEVRRQVIQQRRAAMKAAFDERRRAALATAPGERPSAGNVPPSSVVEGSGSGDGDRGDFEAGVEKRRAADEPAPTGLGLSAPEPTATAPAPEPMTAPRAPEPTAAPPES